MSRIEVVIPYRNQQCPRQWNYYLKICNHPAAQSDPPILSVLCFHIESPPIDPRRALFLKTINVVQGGPQAIMNTKGRITFLIANTSRHLSLFYI